MMRQFMVMIAFITMLIGCSSNDAVYKLSNQASPFQQVDFNTSMDVVMSSTLKNGTLRITVINHSPFEIDFGREYSLEKQVDGKWKIMAPISGNMAFKDIGYRVIPNGKFTYKIVVGNLENGTYRVIKKDLRVRYSKEEFVKSCMFKVN